MAITYSDFDTLSEGRKKYIEKRASKAGLSVADYFKAQSEKAETLLKKVMEGKKLLNDNEFKKTTDNFDFNSYLEYVASNTADVSASQIDDFKPDWGTKTAKIKKTQYKMNMLTWVEAVQRHAITSMPHRKGEFTTMVPFEGKEYMGTWQFTEQHRQQIGDAMRKGCMGFTIDYKVGPKEECAFESIRVCKIKKITPSKETYQVGGNFGVATPTGMASFKSIANSWCNVQEVEA